MRLVLLIVALLSSLSLHAAGFERLLMPGEVIQGHAKYEAQCERCHLDFDKGKQRRLCLDCHERVAADVADGKGFHGRDRAASQQECRTCHTDHKGRDADVVLLDPERFDHNQTDFKLEGAHQGRACALCHQDKPFHEAPSDCIACHKQDDRHAGALGKQCADCHNVERWKKQEFDHDATRFPLRQAHTKVACAACHPGERYRLFEAGEVAVQQEQVGEKKVERVEACSSCHATDDPHAGRFGRECQQCHATEKWDKTRFDHDKQTAWRLTGAHRIEPREKARACNACHASDYLDASSRWPDQQRKGRECLACHRNDDTHRGRNGQNCAACHTTARWGESGFNHDRDTKFRLTGKHADAACRSCHRVAPKEEKLGRECVACHALEDPHQGNLGRDCASCHTTEGWGGKVRFDHDLTAFPLMGMHSVSPCEACHVDPDYSHTPKACNDCHAGDDSHKGVLGEACATCHNPNAWRLWRFDHQRQTEWPLEGKHAGLVCAACHQTPVAERHGQPPRPCIDCHLADDRHQGEFGSDCGRCHGVEDFRKVRLDR